MFFVFSLQLVALLDEAKRAERLLEKDVQLALGYRRASDWSKAKYGVRPLCLHRLLDRGPKPFLIALFRLLLKQLLADESLPSAPESFSDRDLLRAIDRKLDLLLATATRVPNLAKADVPPAETRRA